MASRCPEFLVAVVQREEEVVVAVIGELDLCTVDELSDRLTHLSDVAASDVVLDLTDVTFMGAAGLTTIVNARQKLHDSDRRLLVRNPSPPLQRLFELVGLTDVLEAQPAGRNALVDADLRGAAQVGAVAGGMSRVGQPSTTDGRSRG